MQTCTHAEIIQSIYTKLKNFNFISPGKKQTECKSGVYIYIYIYKINVMKYMLLSFW